MMSINAATQRGWHRRSGSQVPVELTASRNDVRSASPASAMRTVVGERLSPRERILAMALHGRPLLAGRYEMHSVIGYGACGIVYGAFDQHIRTEVAIKVFGPGSGVKESTALTELEALSTVDSPHIVQLRDVVAIPDGRFGIVMSRVKGRPLNDLLTERGPMSESRAIEVVRQVASGLQEAHNQGMTHADIKPANIMLERLSDGEDFVRILDFGLTQFRDRGRDSEFFGTPLYASPEQALSLPLTPASDVYSMGCVLYELLTGEPPFIGEYALDVLEQQIWNDPESLAALRPDVTFAQPIQRLVSAMMDKNHHERPSNAMSVLLEIELLASQVHQLQASRAAVFKRVPTKQHTQAA